MCGSAQSASRGRSVSGVAARAFRLGRHGIGHPARLVRRDADRVRAEQHPGGRLAAEPECGILAGDGADARRIAEADELLDDRGRAVASALGGRLREGAGEPVADGDADESGAELAGDSSDRRSGDRPRIRLRQSAAVDHPARDSGCGERGRRLDGAAGEGLHAVRAEVHRDFGRALRLRLAATVGRRELRPGEPVRAGPGANGRGRREHFGVHGDRPLFPRRTHALNVRDREYGLRGRRRAGGRGYGRDPDPDRRRHQHFERGRLRLRRHVADLRRAAALRALHAPDERPQFDDGNGEAAFGVGGRDRRASRQIRGGQRPDGERSDAFGIRRGMADPQHRYIQPDQRDPVDRGSRRVGARHERERKLPESRDDQRGSAPGERVLHHAARLHHEARAAELVDCCGRAKRRDFEHPSGARERGGAAADFHAAAGAAGENGHLLLGPADRLVHVERDADRRQHHDDADAELLGLGPDGRIQRAVPFRARRARGVRGLLHLRGTNFLVGRTELDAGLFEHGVQRRVEPRKRDGRKRRAGRLDERSYVWRGREVGGERRSVA